MSLARAIPSPRRSLSSGPRWTSLFDGSAVADPAKRVCDQLEPTAPAGSFIASFEVPGGVSVGLRGDDHHSPYGLGGRLPVPDGIRRSR
jgi:hypothetical protein